MRRRLQIYAMKRRYPFNDSAVGSSPRSRQRTMNVALGAARVAAPYARYALRAAWRRINTAQNRRALAAVAADHARRAIARGKRHVTRPVPRYGSRTGPVGRRTTARNAKYGGKFAKARQVSKPSPYITKGFITTTEVTGTVTDPDVVYVGGTCAPGRQTVEHIAYALLRYLFKKCVGMDITSIKQKLHGYHNANVGDSFYHADGFKISVVGVNVSNGAAYEHTYETGITDSIYTICGEAQAGVAPLFSAFISQMLIWAHGTTPAVDNTNYPCFIKLYRKDGNASAFASAARQRF